MESTERCAVRMGVGNQKDKGFHKESCLAILNQQDLHRKVPFLA